MAQGSREMMQRNGQLEGQQTLSHSCGRIRFWQRLSMWFSLAVLLLTGLLGAGVPSAAASAQSNKSDKVVYLSFDDGPGKHTTEVLDILRGAKVPATFFVLGEHAERRPGLIKRITSEGHAIGNHTYNHDYKELYRDFQTFWQQIKRTEDIINNIVGIRPALVRAPGGTYGHFDHTYFDLLKKAGYAVMDWNVDSGDSKRKNVPSSEIAAHATDVPAGTSSAVVLMHDGGAHAETVKALPDIIRYYQQEGYRFEVMQASDKPVQFQVKPAAKYKSRQSPASSWVAKHVNQNAEQWIAAKPLKIELGYMTVELNSDEYQFKDQTLLVPLRSYMNKLGGSISWDQASGTATTWWKDRIVKINPGVGTLTSKRLHDPEARTVQATIESREGTIWVSVGDLMQQLGAKQYTVQSKDSEWVLTIEPPWTSMEHRHFYSMI
ncbi:polysaccharide deacetylase family protein [Paenibacillus sp. TSA_86.1]|uniref:polysaccharide deacetylase family protein n=1 Tax=Paenibacillus sp. TSA_86.1 TaxID=3415649 RepID=UPI0040454B88